MAVCARTKTVLASALVLSLGLGLSACGVKGPLEPPMQAKAEGEAKSADAADPGSNSAAPPKPHEPFILDKLLR